MDWLDLISSNNLYTCALLHPPNFKYMKSLCSCVLLVVFLTSFPLSITRATVNEVSHEATQNFQNLFDFVTVDPSSGDHDFVDSKSMVTW